MKKLVFAIMMIFSQLSIGQEAEVKFAIDKFFEAFHKRDTVAMRASMSDKAVLQSIGEKDSIGTLTDDSVDTFLESIASVPKNMNFEEQIINYDIKVDGTMAHAWLPYVFYINGKRSHSGVNSFQLHKENGIWKIVYLLDTRRK